MIRRLLFATGVLAAGLGFVLIVAPGLATGVTVSELLVDGLGGLAILLAIGAMLRRRGTQVNQAQTGTPETPRTLPNPGADVDTRLRNLLRYQSQSRRLAERNGIHDRLEELAVRVIARREDCSHETARQLLKRGDWTDDQFAAAYFSADVTVPFRARVRASLRGSFTEQCARHAIEELAGVTPGMEVEQ